MRSKLWLSLCVCHAVASMLVWWMGERLANQFVWRSVDWLDRPWSLWTSAWVHMNTQHLISNQLAVGALTAMAWVLKPGWRASLAWVLVWPVIPLAMPFWPHVGYFAGLSGLIHAAVAVSGVYLVAAQVTVPKARRWGMMLLLGLALKLWLEQAWLHPVVWNEGLGMSVVQCAHLVGVLSGLLVMVVLLSWPTPRDA